MREELDLDAIEKRLKDRLAAIMASQSENKGEHPVEFDQTVAVRSQAASRLTVLEQQSIQSALNRLRAGGYGYCVSCGKKIHDERLQNDSSVPTCIACAREEGKITYCNNEFYFSYE